MKKTLQDQYLLIKEGKGHKGVFIKEAKRQFPGLIRNAATFTEVANVLKTKNLINENVIGLEPINQLEPSKKESYEVAFENFLAEAKKKKEKDEKAELKKPSKQVEEDAEKNFDYEDKKNPDNLIFDQIMKGYYTEMKDPKNESKTMEQLKAIVVKNLEKNPIYYTEKGQFGVKDLGYTMDAPGLGEPKEPKGKFKSSGYGDLKENKQNDGMDIEYELEKLFIKYDEELGYGGGFRDDFEDGDHMMVFKNTLPIPDGKYSIIIDDKGIIDKKVYFTVSGDNITMNFKFKYPVNEEKKIPIPYTGQARPTTPEEDEEFRQEKEREENEEDALRGGRLELDEEGKLREIVRSMINEELEEMININPVSGGGGRRKIPTNYLLPDSLISKLNLSDPGPNAPTYDESVQIPHIKVFSKGEEVILAISDLMYIALKGVTRGRSTRAQNVAKATLQKIQDNFTEKDWPAIRALIKKFTDDRISELPVKGQMRPYHMVSFPEGYSLKMTDDGIMIDLPPYKPDTLPEAKIRKVIKENVHNELKEINKLAEYEVYESKLAKIMELIEKKSSFLERINEDEDLKSLTDNKKVKALKKDVKILEKAKTKIEKALAKEAKKIKSIPKKEVIDEDEPLEEFDQSTEDAKELATTIKTSLKPEIEDLKTDIDSLEEDDSLEENNIYGYRYVN